MYAQCKNADTFVPFYITQKHVHLMGKKCGLLGYYAAISCNFLLTCTGW